MINEQGIGTVETRWKRKDGDVWDILLSSVPLDPEDLSKGVTFSALDITERVQAEDEIRRRAGELTALLKSSQSLAATLNLEIVLQTTTESITELMELQSAAIYLLEGETLYLGATSPALPPQFPEEFRRAPLADHPHIREVITTGLPIFLPDTATADLTPAERAVSDARGLRSILYLPLLAEAKVIGALIVASVGEPRVISEAEIEVCLTLTNLAALAVENAHLFEFVQHHAANLEQQVTERKQAEDALRMKTRELETLFSISKHLRVARSADEMLPLVVKEMGNVLKADTSAIILLDPDGQHFKYAFGDGVLAANMGKKFPVEKSISGLVLQTNKPYVTENLSSDPKKTTSLIGCRKIGSGSYCALTVRRRFLGGAGLCAN